MILALHVKSHSLQERDVLIVDRHVKNVTSNFLGFTGIYDNLVKNIFCSEQQNGHLL